ncbi:hypothetical protein [uncultured Fluviicola sp.]|uniref:hypothetical protein n=1 Tax=uncultured Fluviicola sp. TaxID=463303 RepID=UPI0025D6C8C7|nr:hypothetical protein [uncultured Fluviicola sp.]
MSELITITPDRFKYLLETKQNISNFNITEEVIINNETVFGSRSVTFTKCKFDFEFQLNGNFLHQKIYFINCTFEQRFLATNLNLKNLQFLNCKFNQYFTSRNMDAKLLTFELCVFNLQKELLIDQFKAEQFNFVKNEFNRDIQLIPRSVGLISLAGGESNSTLTLSNRGNKNTIDKLFIEFNSNHKTDFLLRNLSVNYFQVHGELKDATFSMNDIKLKTGIFKYFSNQGNILLNSIYPQSKTSIIVLKGVNLGRAIISSTNFSLFDKIQISNSNLVDIVPVNVEWCDSKVMKSANSLSDRKETYRQLKIVAEKNSDVSMKLLFHKYEMRAYLKILKVQKGKTSDKFILRLNQISNNHGLNWFRAFCWLLGLSILWYTFVKYNLKQTEFAPELIGSEIGRFISFINPIHQFDKVFYVDQDLLVNNALLFDGISRITSAYLIYQFISAFRKYSKK